MPACRAAANRINLSVHHTIVLESRAQGTSYQILLTLAHWSDDQGHCYPSIKSIADVAHLSERSVQIHLRKLVQARELDIAIGASPRGTNLLRIRCVQGRPLEVRGMQSGGADQGCRPRTKSAPEVKQKSLIQECSPPETHIRNEKKAAAEEARQQPNAAAAAGFSFLSDQQLRTGTERSREGVPSLNVQPVAPHIRNVDAILRQYTLPDHVLRRVQELADEVHRDEVPLAVVQKGVADTMSRRIEQNDQTPISSPRYFLPAIYRVFNGRRHMSESPPALKPHEDSFGDPMTYQPRRRNAQGLAIEG